ncbi:autophagy-related protein 16-1 isoform X2 [Notothenia coriiceps]|uniref:Autophagy-related protein 16-1 isoform X2 n=1 Tax=Notothenia coriiceps TaxID=8208 RepID=A0A6I9PTH9_9TELE|nr:PREDICTED: autophagy-related protein 16-1-like isoform X2 [Notothenia coriiceps]
MRSWKNHVRGELQQRDQTEKLPFIVSRMEERFDFRKTCLDDVQSKSLDRGGREVGKDTRLLQLQLRESEHLAEKLSQTVSDLTTVLYLKEAELQYWQSRVSHFRQEALSLAKGSNTMKATLSEFEYTVECQSKELAALRTEQKGINQALEQACREKEELLRRWMEEKREEADRLNKYNAAQERWQRFAKQLKKDLHNARTKEFVPTLTSSWCGEAEMPTSVIQRINNTYRGHSEHNHV